jgi:uncharacterized Zn finger protein (UPF0148 family)
MPNVEQEQKTVPVPGQEVHQDSKAKSEPVGVENSRKRIPAEVWSKLTRTQKRAYLKKKTSRKVDSGVESSRKAKLTREKDRALESVENFRRHLDGTLCTIDHIREAIDVPKVKSLLKFMAGTENLADEDSSTWLVPVVAAVTGILLAGGFIYIKASSK